MTWVRLDDLFDEHPKVRMAGQSAAWMYVAGLCYSSRHLTNGLIPSAALAGLGQFPGTKAKKLAATLVEVGLWEKDPQGYRIHDYLKWNRSREQVENERQAAKDRMTKLRKGSADVRPNNGRSSPEVREQEAEAEGETEAKNSSAAATPYSPPERACDESCPSWETLVGCERCGAARMLAEYTVGWLKTFAGRITATQAETLRDMAERTPCTIEAIALVRQAYKETAMNMATPRYFEAIIERLDRENWPSGGSATTPGWKSANGAVRNSDRDWTERRYVIGKMGGQDAAKRAALDQKSDEELRELWEVYQEELAEEASEAEAFGYMQAVRERREG